MSNNILVIDAATEACSAALYMNGDIIHRYEVCPQQHSQKLLPMVDELLAEAEISLTQLDGIAFGRGPGSFTGVRIGVSMAQGLAFGADLSLVGVSSLQALAQGAIRLHDADAVFSAIDARMGEVYMAYFTNEDGLAVEQGGEMVIKPENISFHHAKLSRIFGVGSGWQTYRSVLSGHVDAQVSDEALFPNALDMIPKAVADFSAGLAVPPEQAEPVYVRDTVTWQKLPGR